MVTFCNMQYCKRCKSHLAGAGAKPLRIGTDKRGVISQSLASYELEIGKKKFFHRWPCEILQTQNLAYLPNSDTSVFGHYFHFMITNSTFHDYFRLQKVVDNIYECENQIFLVCDGQKWPNLTKKGSSTMLNLIVNCFSQFLRKIMPFLTLISNSLALILLVIKIFV